MPRNGSGTYSLYTPGNPVVTGTTISSTWANNTLTDIGTALTNSIAKDGQTTPTANLPMGGFKLTGMGTGSALTDSTNLGQVQAGTLSQLASVSGTDTITASSSPAITAYATGQAFRFTSAGANTGAVTLNINSLGAKAITKNGTTALVAGDIPSGAIVMVVYDGTEFQLINPSGSNIAPFTDTTAIVKGSSDATKLLAFEVDTNIPTGTTRTITAQSVSGTMGLVENQIQPLTASVGSNSLTITLNPTSLAFRSSTLGSGTVNVRAVNSAISVVISSGSTLGTINAVQSRIVVIAIDNSGTVELAAVNISGGNDLSETGLISTTAEGGAGAADSANVIYSTTARSNVPYRVVGYVESTQATAGTWATAPSTIQGSGGQALTAMSSIGYGQVWQASGKTSGTTYYNTTGKPIGIMMKLDVSFTGSIVVGGVTVFSDTTNSQYRSAAFAIVPPNFSYVVTTNASWTELR